MPEVGDRAPDFTATASNGTVVKMSDYAGKKNVVLYFYPKDFTSVCTKETCGFRDMLQKLGGDHTAIVGVSIDSDSKHEEFREAHQVNFPLLADPKKEIAKLYGATGGMFGLLGWTKRLTFVIGKDGRIAEKFEGAFSADVHVEGARKALERLSASA